VSFDNPGDTEKVARFFKVANDNRIAMVVHLEPGKFYGPKEVETFLSRIVSASPDIPIQIAHLAGNGPGITSPEALTVFAEARAARDPRTKNLYSPSIRLEPIDKQAGRASPYRRNFPSPSSVHLYHNIPRNRCGKHVRPAYSRADSKRFLRLTNKSYIKPELMHARQTLLFSREKRLRLLDLRPDVIGLATQCHELPIISLRPLRV
jgi:hypothetical protein